MLFRMSNPSSITVSLPFMNFFATRMFHTKWSVLNALSAYPLRLYMVASVEICQPMGMSAVQLIPYWYDAASVVTKPALGEV